MSPINQNPEKQQNKNREKTISILSCITLLVFILILGITGKPVNAKDKKDQPQTMQTDGVGVRLIQSRRERYTGYFYYEAAAGTTRTSTIEVTNNSDKPKVVHIYNRDAYNSEAGTLLGGLINDKAEKSGTWLTLNSQKEILKPKEKKNITVTLKIPENTPPGDYLSFVFIQPDEEESKKLTEKPESSTDTDNTDNTDNTTRNKPAANDKQTSISLKIVARLGVIVWARVPGEEVRTINFSDLKKEFNQGRLFLSFNIQNQGNLFVKPIIAWKITNTAGETILEKKPELYGYILPGSSAKVTMPVATSRPVARGEYHIHVTVSDEKSSLTETKDYTVNLP